MYLCARLNICAFKTPPSAIPKPLYSIFQLTTTFKNNIKMKEEKEKEKNTPWGCIFVIIAVAVIVIILKG